MGMLRRTKFLGKLREIAWRYGEAISKQTKEEYPPKLSIDIVDRAQKPTDGVVYS
jgi:hypothetical protein